MSRQALYGKLKTEAIKAAETNLRQSRWYEVTMGGPDKRTDKVVMNPDWHPYYARINSHGPAGLGGGLTFTLVVRDGVAEYFKKVKQAAPDFKTPALKAMTDTLSKHYPELVMIELLDNFNKTDGITAVWQ